MSHRHCGLCVDHKQQLNSVLELLQRSHTVAVCAIVFVLSWAARFLVVIRGVVMRLIILHTPESVMVLLLHLCGLWLQAVLSVPAAWTTSPPGTALLLHRMVEIAQAPVQQDTPRCLLHRRQHVDLEGGVSVGDASRQVCQSASIKLQQHLPA